MELDKRRRKIYDFLTNNDITINKKFYLKFYNYLLQEDQNNILCKYLSILIGDYNDDISIKLLNEIIQLFQKRRRIYTFKELFKINPEWYEYYCQNADTNGTLIGNESRKGVEKKYVNDIEILRKKIYFCIKKNISLEEHIIIYQTIKNKVIN